ncbi:LURP-one-like protein (DUF567) [Rhynchospora pubera]|uniref:LURP-one-like protein (DUF567) n=1 Tax=Rhynchospora pubera TaxID=906938 RepID=A0AAV8HV66_9POAL|nr:LURP-one-like protein (DUF567) [Rhynchospora pubera]KAJ4797834.1 LURP-one-like protein (DUF567) [Rhynchospora pubera]KAJ4821735.1 LURP-one-like protein (DUF567) [Rhynchospora pubera]
MAASSSPAPAPLMSPSGVVAVVGPQFCAPYVVALTVTKKALSLSDGDFVVSDVNGGVLMKVQGRVLSLHSRRVLCDSAGSPIVSMREKKLSMHHRWNVYRGDSSDHKDLLFTVKKSHMLQLKTELDVFFAANTAEQHCDFKVKGSWFERSCTFYLGDTNTIIALMSRQYELKNVLLGKDTFGVTVYPNVDYAFVVAIIVILDEIHRDRMEHGE